MDFIYAVDFLEIGSLNYTEMFLSRNAPSAINNPYDRRLLKQLVSNRPVGSVRHKNLLVDLAG